MFGRTSLLARELVKPNVRFRSHPLGGVPGDNLPIGIRNRYKLTGLMLLFMTIGFGAPFFVVRLQYWKKNT